MTIANSIAVDMPQEVQIVGRTQDSQTVFTLQLQLTDPQVRSMYRSAPGQFNMLYLYGAGEVPISIVSNDTEKGILKHTIRTVGRVSQAMAELKPGDSIGFRGPFGRGWPLEDIRGHQVMIVTGGLGCAPVVSAINHIMDNRSDYGKAIIIQGVKRADDLIWREQYEAWESVAETQVLLTADVASNGWPWHVGMVPELLERADFDPKDVRVLMCGPEAMMRAAVHKLTRLEVPRNRVWLSLERNMQCGLRQCGHCQFGSQFLCSDGPVFKFTEIADLFGTKGF